MLSAIGRTLLAFVLGALAGALGTGWLFYSGAGDLILKPGPIVQDLERRLEEVEAQRDQLGRSLEDLIRRSEQSEARFRGLEQRLQTMLAERERAPAKPPVAPPAPPSAPGGGEGESE